MAEDDKKCCNGENCACEICTCTEDNPCACMTDKQGEDNNG